MPLLPGETRETDKYVSGLSFFDDIGKVVKNAAHRTQERIEYAYAEVSNSLSGASNDLSTRGGFTEATSFRSAGGHLVPLKTDWDSIGLAAILPAISNTFVAIRDQGDPLVAAPGTTLLVAINICAFSRRVPVRHWCLLPHMVIQHGEVFRLLTASFIHCNAPQLLSNMSTLLACGLQLEGGRGWTFIAEVLGMTLATNLLRLLSMAVRAGCRGASLRSMPGSLSVLGGLGFSATCLALQVVSLHQTRRRSGSWPALEASGQLRQMTCWVWFGWSVLHSCNMHHETPQLLQANLEHELCGIVTGLGYIWVPRLFRNLQEARRLRAWARVMHGPGTHGGGQRLGFGDQRDRPQGALIAEATAARQSLAGAQGPRGGSYVGGTGGGLRLGHGDEGDLEFAAAGRLIKIHPVYLHTALVLVSWVGIVRLAS